MIKVNSNLSPDEMQKREANYLNKVAEDNRFLKTEGLQDSHAELTDVFIMLEAEESQKREISADIPLSPARLEEMGLKKRIAEFLGLSEETEVEEDEEFILPPVPIPLSKVLKEHDHLLILGEPGSGKTTTLQFITFCYAIGKVKDRLELDEPGIPFQIELRKYNSKDRLDRFIIQQLNEKYVPEALARNWLDNGKLVLLLDGLDEVTEKNRDYVVEAIDAFLSTTIGQQSRVVITSRLAGYRIIRGFSSDIGQYVIRPFSGREDALSYIVRWLRALRKDRRNAINKEAEQLLTEIMNQGGLRKFIGNPLLLRIVLAVYVESGELISNRAELYRRYLDEIIWERAKKVKSPAWSRLTVERALEVAAWELQTRREKTVAELVKTIECENAEVTDGYELLDFMRERLGILSVYGYDQGELVAFSHLTFMEFFVARWLKKSWEKNNRVTWHFLRPRLHHPEWREPIMLFAGLLQESEFTQLTQRILKSHSPYEWELHRDILLSADIISENKQASVQLVERVTFSLWNLLQDTQVKWRHMFFLPTVLFLISIFVFWVNRLPIIYIAPLIFYLILFVWIGVVGFDFFPIIRVIFTLPHRLSGRCASEYLLYEIMNRLSRLLRLIEIRNMDSLIHILQDMDEKSSHNVVSNIREWGDLNTVEPFIPTLIYRHAGISLAPTNARNELGYSQKVKLAIFDLSDRNYRVCLEAASDLGFLSSKIIDIRLIKKALLGLWMQLTRPNLQATYTIYNSLSQMVARLTELQVRQLRDEHLLSPISYSKWWKSKTVFIILSVLGILMSTIIGLSSNIIATYLQEHYQILINPVLIGTVFGVFIFALVCSIVIILIQQKQIEI